MKTAARSPDVDLEEEDTAEGIDPPGADLSEEVLTMPFVPQQADEFTCTSCSWCNTAAGSPATAPDGRSAWTAPDPAGRVSHQPGPVIAGRGVGRGPHTLVMSVPELTHDMVGDSGLRDDHVRQCQVGLDADPGRSASGRGC